MRLVREKTLKHTPIYVYFKFFYALGNKILASHLKKPRISGAFQK
jgi:hypothetical protein